jgi:hypothetical protein
MTSHGTRRESLYALALRFYPAHFRQAYEAAMRQAFRDALADTTLSRRTLVATVLRDLATSLPKEHFAMLRDTFARPILVYNAMVLTALATGLALALYAIPQSVLRQGANDPQIALAGDLAARLEQGVAPATAVPSASVDIARSLSPFVIVYDDQGHPLASQAQLNGQTPIPPAGVFSNVRQRGEERLSWQPVLGSGHSVRIAAVIERVQGINGAQSGFVLAGRNMREVESRISQVSQMAGLTWIGMLGVILLGTITFGWYTRPGPVSASVSERNHSSVQTGS